MVARQLHDLIQSICSHSGEWPEEEQFRLVYPFRGIINCFNSSIALFGNRDVVFYLTLAHLLAVVLAVALKFPFIQRAHFISIRLRSLKAAERMLQKTTFFFCCFCEDSHNTADLMAFPRTIINIYQDLYT